MHLLNQSLLSIILREGENSFIDSHGVAEKFEVHFSYIVSEMGFRDEHVMSEQAISTHSNHPIIIRMWYACGYDIHDLNFQTVNHDSTAQ